MDGGFPIEPFDPKRLPDPSGGESLHRLCLKAAVTGADAFRLTRAAVRRDEGTLRIGNRFVAARTYREIAFVALGRAAVSQALAVNEALGEFLTQGYVAAPDALPHEVPFRSTVAPSTGPGHPEAAEVGAAVRELALGLGPRDLLLLLLSAGALGYLALPPDGLSVAAWQAELAAIGSRGATAAEVGSIARIDALGPVGGRFSDGVTAEVATLVIDRGDGPVRLGGGPTVPVTDAERTDARATLERVGDWADRPSARRAAFAVDASRRIARPVNVERPVVIAEPADALREASAAVAEKKWLPRLADLTNALPPEAAADRFLRRVEEIVDDLQGDPLLAESKGIVVFGPMTLDLAEGVDERPAIGTFLARTSRALRRREMTVGIARTCGAPSADPSPSGGVVAPKGGVAGVPARSLPMRSGITDVGAIATAVVPRRP